MNTEFFNTLRIKYLIDLLLSYTAFIKAKIIVLTTCIIIIIIKT